MQLVNDCVVMYDTMKDKRIGIPEVIEKFGASVPTKSSKSQALIGDSSDNVPGVPGIGAKTAAQLITRIRRSRNAAQARRRDQAGQAPADADRQCRAGAHLEKACDAWMTRCRSTCRSISSACTSRTTRTSSLSQDDGVQDADAARRRQDRHRRERGRGGWRTRPAAPPAKEKRCAETGQRRPVCAGSHGDNEPNGALTPIALAASRSEAARTAKIDRSKYETVGTLARLKEWIARAHEAGRRRGRHRDHQPRLRCRRICAAFRWRWRPTKPATCRSVIATAAATGKGDLFSPEAEEFAKAKSPSATRSPPSRRCSRTRPCSRSART